MVFLVDRVTGSVGGSRSEISRGASGESPVLESVQKAFELLALTNQEVCAQEFEACSVQEQIEDFEEEVEEGLQQEVSGFDELDELEERPHLAGMDDGTASQTEVT